MSTSETTTTLSEIINSLDEDDLRELCSSYCDDTNDNNAVNIIKYNRKADKNNERQISDTFG